MAALTELDLSDAQSITEAYGLGEVLRVEPIAAGSVNSNYFLVTEAQTIFVRLYEEQGVQGVAYEWALLDHLGDHIPVARRLDGPGPGEFSVRGRQVAAFERVEGVTLRQSEVLPNHLGALGSTLGQVHERTAAFGWRRRSRFDLEGLLKRLETIDEVIVRGNSSEVSTFREEWPGLRARLESALRQPSPALRRLPIHGDLFRDNVLWKSRAAAMPVALIDWESAADGPCVQDLAVVTLAWCVGADFDWALGRALFQGYETIRCLDDGEWEALYDELRRAAARFLTTRITDFFLRRLEMKANGKPFPGVYKDYRRFTLRLDKLEELGQDGVRARLEDG